MFSLVIERLGHEGALLDIHRSSVPPQLWTIVGITKGTEGRPSPPFVRVHHEDAVQHRRYNGEGRDRNEYRGGSSGTGGSSLSLSLSLSSPLVTATATITLAATLTVVIVIIIRRATAVILAPPSPPPPLPPPTATPPPPRTIGRRTGPPTPMNSASP